MGRLPVVAMEEQIEAISDSLQINQQIEQAFSDTGRAPEMCKSLEDLAFAVSQIREITPKEAALIQIAGDVATSGSGSSSEENCITPAMEDMLNGKFSAGDIVKKVKDTVASILAAIRELIRRVGNYVVSYISRATVVAGGSETRLKKLELAYRERGSSWKQDPAKRIKMVLPTVDGRVVNTMDDLISASKDYLKILEVFTRVANDANYNYGSGMVRLFESGLGKGVEADIPTYRDDLIKLMKLVSKSMDVGTVFPNARDMIQSDGSIVVESRPLLGGVKLVSSTLPDDVFDKVTLTSSVSVRDYLGKVSRKNYLTVQFQDGATTAQVEVQPMTERQLREVFDVIKQLLSFYSGRASNTSLVAAMQKRQAFAKQCCKSITDRVQAMDQTNPLAYALTVESVGITDSITRNATLPYLRLSENAGRIISYLLTAASKSLVANTSAA